MSAVAVGGALPAALAGCRHWVFDMDGTLTVAVHDFALIRRELGIRSDEDILAHLAALPAQQAAAKRAWLLAHEHELAVASLPAPGARALIGALHARGCRLAILTRNMRELAALTLRCIGLEAMFDSAVVLGREEAMPKPDPDGLLRIAAAWGVAPQQLTMVGDHEMDLLSGRAAGATTVLVGEHNAWPALADLHVRDCAALLDALPG